MGTQFTVGGTEAVPHIEVESKVQDAFEKHWGVIVWDNPVTLMNYVVHVFQTVLKMSHQQARKHMLEVHEKGKSLVAVETREKAEFLVQRIQRYGLSATMEPLS